MNQNNVTTACRVDCSMSKLASIFRKISDLDSTTPVDARARVTVVRRHHVLVHAPPRTARRTPLRGVSQVELFFRARTQSRRPETPVAWVCRRRGPSCGRSAAKAQRKRVWVPWAATHPAKGRSAEFSPHFRPQCAGLRSECGLPRRRCARATRPLGPASRAPEALCADPG